MIQLIGGPMCGREIKTPQYVYLHHGLQVAGTPEGVYELEVGYVTAVWRFVGGIAV